MGVVYEAYDPGIDRRVAIKTLEPDLVPEEERQEVVERFRRETKIVGRLEHPAIVTVFDVGLERSPLPGGRQEVLHFYVMEFLDGRSLARVLRDDGALPLRSAVEVARSVAEALSLSHGAGVIHRDIKPSNVFLRTRGDAVLLDFGIAKSGSVALTKQGQILGTPSYLAPERLREKDLPIDGRADLFSLGVLLFTMITGDAPFSGGDVYEVIDKIAREAHPQLEGATPAARALGPVVDRLLAKRPADRFPDAASVVAALDAVLACLNEERLPEEPVERSVEGASLAQASVEPDLPAVREGAALEPVRPPAWSEERTVEHTRSEAALPLFGVDNDHETDSEHAPVPVAPLLETRPELALLRQTRELGPRLEEASVWGAEETLADVATVDQEEMTLAEVGGLDVLAEFEAAAPLLVGGAHRIEVSLVDEADVIVRPAPLSELDEDPTQAASPDRPAPNGSPVVASEPPLRGEGQISTEQLERPRRTPPRPHRPLVAGAAVAKQTIGVGRPPRGVSVRVRGARLDASDSDPAPLGRRLAVLGGAVAISVGLGLLLARWGTERPKRPAPAPAVAALVERSAPSPRSGPALWADAEAARTAGQLERAEALYREAARAAIGSELAARATLGRADVLRALGRRTEAVAAYRTVVSSGPDKVAQEARLALSDLGAGKPELRLSSPPPPRARPVRPAQRPERALSPDAACREILFRNAPDPEAALAAFESLAEAHPEASCAFWNLGVKYEKLGERRRAASAYRRYLELVPDSPAGGAVRGRIEKLESQR